MRKIKKFSSDQIKGFLQEQKESGLTGQQMADKYGFGLSTFVNWKSKFNGKAKRKVKATRPRVSVETNAKEEQAWEKLFNKFIFHRDEAQKHSDEAEKAKKELQDYVERLR